MTIARPLPDYLVKRYHGWKATAYSENSAWFRKLADEGQHPRAMIISCCDSRVHVTAIFGADPNWGRILQTLGAGRVALRLDSVVVELCGVPVFRRGASAGSAARRRAARRLLDDEVEIEVSLGAGKASARVWTCDLSYDYIRINAEYTT